MNKGFAVLSLMLALAGCVSPEQRIQDNPQVFAKATPQQQALIKQGQVALDFTPDFVELAMGRPDRITERTDPGGTETIWHYTQRQDYGYYPAYYDPWWGPGWGWWGPRFVPVTYVPAASYERDRLRVVFREGKVRFIERVVKS